MDESHVINENRVLDPSTRFLSNYNDSVVRRRSEWDCQCPASFVGGKLTVSQSPEKLADANAGVGSLANALIEWREATVSSPPDNNALTDPGIHRFLGDADDEFAKVLADGVNIQSRFVAEPVLGREGKGFMRSKGVSDIVESKEQS